MLSLFAGCGPFFSLLMDVSHMPMHPNRLQYIYIRVSDKPINLTSPRFPTDMYPPNVNTHYNITVSPNYALKLTIVSLNLEPRCCNYLQIIEFNRPIYTFRGILPSL